MQSKPLLDDNIPIGTDIHLATLIYMPSISEACTEIFEVLLNSFVKVLEGLVCCFHCFELLDLCHIQPMGGILVRNA